MTTQATTFTPHVKGCKVCGKVITKRYGPDTLLPEHDTASDQFTHEYVAPNPTLDTIIAIFGEDALDTTSSYSLRTKSGLAIDSYRVGSDKWHGGEWAGIVMSFGYGVDRMSRQARLKADGTVDIAKAKKAAAELESFIVGQKQRQHDELVKRSTQERLVKRVQDASGLGYSGLKVEASYGDKVAITLWPLTEDEAAQVIALFKSLKGK